MRDKFLVTFNGTEKKFKKINDIMEEYKDINLQYHEITELLKYYDKGLVRQRMHDRFKFMLNHIVIHKIIT